MGEYITFPRVKERSAGPGPVLNHSEIGGGCCPPTAVLPTKTVVNHMSAIPPIRAMELERLNGPSVPYRTHAAQQTTRTNLTDEADRMNGVMSPIGTQRLNSADVRSVQALLERLRWRQSALASCSAQCASGSGRSWNFTSFGGVPLPPSTWNGVRLPADAQIPRPFQPPFGSSIRPSMVLA
jgi:hypothetical protein